MGRRPKRKRKKPKFLVDLLAIGEGPKPGKVYEKARRLAARGSNARVMIVDLKKPGYKPPKNLAYLQTDAVRHLQGLSPNSVKRIEDKYFFDKPAWGKHGRSAEGTKRALKDLRRTAVLGLGKRSKSDLTPGKMRRNTMRYVKSVKRALVPGGRFVMVTGPQAAETNCRILRQAGFEIKSNRQLTPEQIRKSGSRQAVAELEGWGKHAHKIVAVKPR